MRLQAHNSREHVWEGIVGVQTPSQESPSPAEAARLHAIPGGSVVSGPVAFPQELSSDKKNEKVRNTFPVVIPKWIVREVDNTGFDSQL